VFAAYLNTLRWNCVTATDHAAQRTFEQLLSAAGDSGSSAFLPWSTGAALLDGRDPIPDTIIRQLQSSAPRDVRELLPFLESRGQEYIGDAEQKLAERGAVEARAMREILETQKKHIQTTYARHENMDDRQLRLNYGDDLEELRQLELNKRYWAKRLETIDNELNTEPERIRDLYQVKARRIEPVGLVYLWPVTG